MNKDTNKRSPYKCGRSCVCCQKQEKESKIKRIFPFTAKRNTSSLFATKEEMMIK